MSADERPGQRLAALFRRARADQHLTQDEVITASRVGAATYKRYERGAIDAPSPAQVAAICRVLQINPREAAIAIGLGTREDFDLPPEEPTYPDVVTTIGRALTDPDLAEHARAALLHAVTGAFESWSMAVAPTSVERIKRP